MPIHSMEKFGVIKLAWVFILLVICMASVSPAHLGRLCFPTSQRSHSSDGHLSTLMKSRATEQPQYYTHPSINQVTALKATTARTRSGSGVRDVTRSKSRLGDRYNGAFGLGSKDNYDGRPMLTRTSELGPHAVVSPRFKMVGDLCFGNDNGNRARMLHNGIMTPVYPITSKYGKNAIGHSATALHLESSHGDSVLNHAMQGLAGDIGYDLAKNTRYTSHGTHAAHWLPNVINGMHSEMTIAGTPTTDDNDYSGLSESGASGFDSLGISDNKGLGAFDNTNSGTLVNAGLLPVDADDIDILGTLNNNGVSTMSYEGLERFGSNNFGVIDQFRPQQTTSISSVDLLGDAEQERIYQGNRPEISLAALADPVSIQLAYKKLLTPFQKLGQRHNISKTIKEDKLVYGPRVVSADDQQRIIVNDIPEKRFQVLQKPIAELTKLDSARGMLSIPRRRVEMELAGLETVQGTRQEYDDSYLPLVTYSDLDDGPGSLDDNRFVPGIPMSSVLSFAGRQLSRSEIDDDSSCGSLSQPLSDYQVDTIVTPSFNGLSPAVQRKISSTHPSMHERDSAAHQSYLPNSNRYGLPRYWINNNTLTALSDIPLTNRSATYCDSPLLNQRSSCMKNL